jgi:hypothetical protein
MKKIFELYGQFSPRWMKRKGFWRLIWFAIVAKFGYVTTSQDQDNCCFSIGTSWPLISLWKADYDVHRAGKVLGETVLFYSPSYKDKKLTMN